MRDETTWGKYIPVDPEEGTNLGLKRISQLVRGQREEGDEIRETGGVKSGRARETRYDFIPCV